ncbi:class I SAM-dependent methyltransferase [Desulfotruncus alcoholivorax]|uniref:class I SAM-dependent methyltransferase n=1 Tax=Desulfotruncus alcoholivorax TaxID=265477 RepID=UPI000420FE54|nr:methyltransferase domain-containing protein [Desulfotruncus alcoholivorax]
MLKDYFDQMSAKWDSIMGPEVSQKLQEIVHECGIAKGARVLDVACGTGILTPILLNCVGKQGKVTGIDFAPKMIDIAKAKNNEPNVSFVVADVEDLPFDDDSFDYVFCNGALPHFPDIMAALEEMKRVLRNNGQLVICHASSREEINQTHQRIGHPVCNDLLPTAEELESMLRKAGYDNIRYSDTPDRFVFSAFKC